MALQQGWLLFLVSGTCRTCHALRVGTDHPATGTVALIRVPLILHCRREGVSSGGSPKAIPAAQPAQNSSVDQK